MPPKNGISNEETASQARERLLIVFLSVRYAVRFTSAVIFCRVREIVSRDDLRPLGQDLLPEIDIGALEPHNQWT